ncbi:AEC family transporter [Enterococcus sp. CSURQ0835]|uniref:AEC family transporter n=1 Tax=Enterococcus sp. CSURQ0835 TaxID=2681394 RepID=UPI00135CD7AD|nr:AEC family transporter [Enterococcus sp. CSURQ0835]
MTTILLNSAGLFLIIVLAYLTKRANLLSKADGNTLSLIVINVTLPAAIIVNLTRLEVKLNLLLLIVLGIGLNLLFVLLGGAFSRKQKPVERAFIMHCGSGYNVGNFALPFVQSFLPQAIPLLSLFDIGNSVMLAGGSNVVVEALTGDAEKRPSPALIAKRLARSVPFLVYLVMLILRSFAIELPKEVTQVIQPIASANTFLSMFMIGLFLELRLPRKELNLVGRLLAIKYGFGLAIAVLFALLPLPAIIKLVLCLLAIGPVPTFGVISSVNAGMRAEVVGFTSSLSFLISLPLMTAMLLVTL